MNKKEIISNVDKIMKDSCISDKLFYLNDLRQELQTKKEKGYFFARVRHYYGITPELFKNQEQLQLLFGNDNIYLEIVQRDSQRQSTSTKNVSES